MYDARIASRCVRRNLSDDMLPRRLSQGNVTISHYMGVDAVPAQLTLLGGIKMFDNDDTVGQFKHHNHFLTKTTSCPTKLLIAIVVTTIIMRQHYKNGLDYFFASLLENCHQTRGSSPSTLHQ